MKKLTITGAALDAELRRVATTTPKGEVIPELEAKLGKSRNKPWTLHEERVLRTYYGRVPTAEIERYLNRSRAQVRNKVTDLGLAFRRDV